MLDDNEQAIAYAHLTEAIEDWNSLLNVLYDAILAEEKPILNSMDKHLSAAIKVLDVY